MTMPRLQILALGLGAVLTATAGCSSSLSCHPLLGRLTGRNSYEVPVTTGAGPVVGSDCCNGGTYGGSEPILMAPPPGADGHGVHGYPPPHAHEGEAFGPAPTPLHPPAVAGPTAPLPNGPPPFPGTAGAAPAAPQQPMAKPSPYVPDGK